jgi:hypothetical protein
VQKSAQGFENKGDDWKTFERNIDRVHVRNLRTPTPTNLHESQNKGVTKFAFRKALNTKALF